MSTISAGTTLTTALVQTGDTTGELVIKTNNGNTTAATFTTAGNVGIGVTPSAWTSPDFLGLQVGSGVAVYGRGSGDADRGGVSTNAYNDGAWKYIATGNATRAEQTDGSHIWYTASSGTAGNSITFTSVMELDASSNLKFNSGYGSVATAYGCRAWVNFNGTGTVAIRASGNVTSITDNGTGDYTVNFTNAMPNVNYCAVGTVGDDVTTTASVRVTSFNTYQTGSVRMRTINNNTDDAFDVELANVSIFR